MKYSAEEIKAMSYSEWMETIAKELNAAGFKTRGIAYKVYDASTFFLGAINDAKAMDYLKSVGLVNNGRCPMCGGPIKGTPSRFTDGMNPNLNFHICSSCRREGQRMSINPANNSGCMLTFVLLPWYVIKDIFTNY